MSEFLSRDAVLTAVDVQREIVNVPEWGGRVLVWGLNGDELNDYQASLVVMDGKKVSINRKGASARLAALSIKDENGARTFSDEDVAALGKKSGAALQRVVNVAQRLSGLDDDEIEEAGKD